METQPEMPHTPTETEIDSSQIEPHKPKEGQELESLSTVNLENNLGRLESNIAELDHLSPEVLTSTEGQELTKNFSESAFGKVKEFWLNASTKVAEAAGKLENPEKVAMVLRTIAAGAVIAPALLQFARMKWPEMGAMLDALPDVVQYIAHIDAFGSLTNHVMDVGGSQNGVGMDLLADISSGRIDRTDFDLELNRAALKSGEIDQSQFDDLRAKDRLWHEMTAGGYYESQAYPWTLAQVGVDTPEKLNEYIVRSNEIQQEKASSKLIPGIVGTAVGNAVIVGGAAHLLGKALNKIGALARGSVNSKP